jgi:hypothetical protein
VCHCNRFWGLELLLLSCFIGMMLMFPLVIFCMATSLPSADADIWRIAYVSYRPFDVSHIFCCFLSLNFIFLVGKDALPDP